MPTNAYDQLHQHFKELGYRQLCQATLHSTTYGTVLIRKLSDHEHCGQVLFHDGKCCTVQTGDLNRFLNGEGVNLAKYLRAVGLEPVATAKPTVSKPRRQPTVTQPAQPSVRQSIKDTIRALLTVGPCTLEELCAKTGASTRTVLGTIAFLKTPARAGKLGPMNIVKAANGSFNVAKKSD